MGTPPSGALNTRAVGNIAQFHTFLTVLELRHQPVVCVCVYSVDRSIDHLLCKWNLRCENVPLSTFSSVRVFNAATRSEFHHDERTFQLLVISRPSTWTIRTEWKQIGAHRRWSDRASWLRMCYCWAISSSFGGCLTQACSGSDDADSLIFQEKTRPIAAFPEFLKRSRRMLHAGLWM